MNGVIAVVGGLLLAAAVCGYIGLVFFAIFRDLFQWATKPMRERNAPGSPAAIAKYGEPLVTIDQRIYENLPTPLSRQISKLNDYRPRAAEVRVPAKRGYVPVSETVGLRLPDGEDLEEQQPSEIDAYTDALSTLLVPADAPPNALLRFELERRTQPYPVEGPAMPGRVGPPNLSDLSATFDIPHPSILYPGGRSFADLKVKEVAIYRPWTSRYEDAVAGWNEKEAEHRASVGRLREALAELKAKIEGANNVQDERFADAQGRYRNDKAEYEQLQAEDRQAIQALIDEWDNSTIDDPGRLAALTLRYMPKPRWLPSHTAAKFDAESAVLIVEAQFPDVGRIAWYRRGATPPKPATKTEARAAAESLYPTLALRYAWEVARSANDNLVQTVVVNGWAEYIDGATGETKRAFVTSLLAKVTALRALHLQKLDVHQAFAALKGVAGRAQTVTPVAPVVRMDTSDRRFVDPKAVLDDIGEQNLATMDWGDFEHLCRELFERVFAGVGAEVKVTQASRDQGVDAVIFDPDPIRGGKIVIQAKRYSGTVDVSAVRDLYGTLQHEGAMKGILVTTSGFGPDAYAFIAGKPLTLINGGELLGILAQHGYQFRIDLAEAKKMAREQFARQ